MAKMITYLDVTVRDRGVERPVWALFNRLTVRVLFANCEKVHLDRPEVAIWVFERLYDVQLAIVDVWKGIVVVNGAYDIATQLIDVVQEHRCIDLGRVDCIWVCRQE